MSSDEFVDSGDALAGDDEDFDEYSDSFEGSSGGDASDGGNSEIDAGRSDESPPGSPVALYDFKTTCCFECGELVQVYWSNENEWFNGCVAQIDALSGRILVQYEDGEEAWETGDRLRYAPEAFSLSSEAFQQLQWTLSSTTQPGGNAALLRLLGARVLVYWRESSSWFPGSIVQVGQQHSALQVEYDDGDLRWEPEGDFLNILVLIEPSTASKTSVTQALASSQPAAAVAEPDDVAERVLVPRAYKVVLSDHFKPVREPRPYISVTNSIGSVLTARRGKYCERRYLHTNAKLECTPYEIQQSDEILSRDCLVQTDIAGGGMWTDDDSRDHSQYSQCC